MMWYGSCLVVRITSRENVHHAQLFLKEILGTQGGRFSLFLILLFLVLRTNLTSPSLLASLVGDYFAEKKLQRAPDNREMGKGEFISHPIFNGVNTFWEGHTVCAPKGPLSKKEDNIPFFVPVARASDGNSLILVHEAHKNGRRMVLNCAYTQLFYAKAWKEPGQIQFVQSLALWLLPRQ